jgi:hypothetical protein
MADGDLRSRLEADVTDWSAGMQQAAKDGELVTRVIHEQDVSWRALASSAVPAIGQVSAAVVGLVGTLATIQHQRHLIASVTGPIAAVGGAAIRWIGPIARVVGYAVPQWRLLATVISTTAVAIKVANSDTARGFASQVSNSERVVESFGRLKESFSQFGSVISSPFEAGEAAFTSLIDAINPLPALVDFTAGKVANFADGATTQVQNLTTWWQKWQDIAAAVPVIWQEGADAEGAQRIFDEAAAIRERNAEQQAALQRLQELKPAYDALRQVQANAAAGAELNAQLQEVRDAKTIEALNAQEQKWQKLIKAKVQSGELDAKAVEDTQKIFDLIANQRVQIESKKNPVADAAIKANQQQIDKEQFGDIGAALNSFADEGASQEQINKLRQQLELLENIKAEKESQRALDQEAAEAARRQEQIDKSAESQINGLKDQVDLLTGSASKADIAVRKALEAGMSQEQADEIGSLTEQLDLIEEANRQKEGKLAKGGRGMDLSFGAEVKGSSGAFSAIAKAMSQSMGQSATEKNTAATAKAVEKLPGKFDKLITAVEDIEFVGMEIG